MLDLDSNDRAAGTRLDVPSQSSVPLVVDLDGTLIRSNLLLESLVALLKKSVRSVFLLPLWLSRGRAALKTEVARRTEFDLSTIPFNEPFLEFLRREKKAGRTLVLATGASRKLAVEVADNLGLFDEVLATTHNRNLTSHSKLEALQERYGETGFDYAGNESADYPIWQAARHAIVVNAVPRVARWARQHARVEREFPSHGARPISYVQALRVHQWAKNLLLFTPLVAALRLTDAAALLQLGIGFLAFSLCASSVYILNDIVDVQDDRQHPRKCHRPFASGELSQLQGIVMIPALLGASVLLALLLPLQFLAVLGIYYATTLAYTFKLKQVEVLDVVALALLYTTRVFAGGAAADIHISFWLLAFSTFLFLSLAFAKRCAELAVVRDRGMEVARGRGYRVTDLPILFAMGIGAAYVATFVFGLYLNSPQVGANYQYPAFLWAFVPILLYWTTRVWLKTFRSEMHDDPVVFAARDPVSIGIAAAGGGVLVLAV